MPGKVYIVIDGQAGSCGKGKIVGYLARNLDIDVTINHNMPNAGHTFVFDNGRKIITHHLPIGFVNPKTTLLIGAGAVINPDILYKELNDYQDLLNNRVLYIHERAAIVNEKHINYERNNIRSGSTFQGSNAANCEKAMRLPGVTLAKDYPWKGKIFIYDDNFLLQIKKSNMSILIETSQGFDLDINHGLPYPYTTGRGCTIMQALADSGVSHKADITSFMVFRPYPIRISNTSVEGNIYTGDYDGSKEITWEEVCQRAGLPKTEEYTTVTKKLRRVFEFNYHRFYNAIEVNDPDYLILNFAQYIDASILKSNDIKDLYRSKRIIETLKVIEELYNKQIAFLGTGECESDLIALNPKGLNLNLK